jgi:DNA-binding transcriptional regulator GbsR (MarR family)
MNATLRLAPQPDPRDDERVPDSGRYALASGIQPLIPRPDIGVDPHIQRVQDMFIDCWASMAGSFAMDRAVGRVHALVYISLEPIDLDMIALRLASTEAACEPHVEHLLEWGLIRIADHGPDGKPRYQAEQDPWSWFLRTIRERHSREFVPLQRAVRDVCALARQMSAAGRDDTLTRTLERVERFTRFIEEFSRLIDAFVNLGAKPMAAVLKTVARLMPRSARA